MNSVAYFANVTLSSLYFDVRKDSLYADSIESEERRGVLTVLEKVRPRVDRDVEPLLTIVSTDFGYHDGNLCPNPSTSRRGSARQPASRHQNLLFHESLEATCMLYVLIWLGDRQLT